MLSNVVYKSMPYTYLIIGLVFAFVVEPDVMYVSIFLVLSVVLLIAWIKQSSRIEREKIEQNTIRDRHTTLMRSPEDYVHRNSGNRRIVREGHTFPLFDRMGLTITRDRRNNERRRAMY